MDLVWFNVELPRCAMLPLYSSSNTYCSGLIIKTFVCFYFLELCSLINVIYLQRSGEKKQTNIVQLH